MTILQYVQVESDVALIDSRVYCRDIIEVDHGNWLTDTLDKHKIQVELRFGAIRFETDVLKHESYKGSTRQKYALLTEAQSNAFLVLSKNTAKVRHKKLQLIADFEAAKQQIRASLERSLNPQINPQLDPTKFDYCFDAAVQITGHRSRYSTMRRLLDYLDEGKDYQWNGSTLWLCNPIFYSFIAASRTVRGIDVEQIGQTVTLDWHYYCRVNHALKTPKNALFPKACFIFKNGHSQLTLNLGA
jgi:phage regulator Rha-like protein